MRPLADDRSTDMDMGKYGLMVMVMVAGLVASLCNNAHLAYVAHATISTCACSGIRDAG